MGLLFLNALKGIRKKKVQIVAIITLVMLSAAIYTAMNTSLDRLEDRYYEYLVEQNVEEFSFVPVIDYKSDVTIETLDKLFETNFKEISDEEKQVLNLYRLCLINKCDNLDSNSYFYIENIFRKYKANLEISKTKIDNLALKYDFKYEVDDAKVFKENKYIYKAIPYNENKQINKPYLVEGNYPVNDNEITVLKDFALKNDLEIGSNLTINNKEYKIVGYVFASDHVYPLLSISMPFFDNKYNTIIFMNDSTYSSFNGVNEVVMSAKLNVTDLNNRARFTISFGADTTDTNPDENPILLIMENEKDTVSIGIDSIIRFMRTDMIKTEFEPNRIFSESFMYLLLGISVFVIGVVTKKRIDDERLQIGVLKSLGYNSFAIATSYLVYPIIGSLVGGVLGYLFGILLNEPITSMYVGYYNIPLESISFNLSYLSKSVLTPMIMLSTLCYLIALFMLRKKPLNLLREGSNLKINVFSRIVTFVTKPLPFKSRFKYSLAFRSIGKLFIVSLTSLSAGLLIVLTLIGSNLFNSMIDKTFESVNYNYIVNYFTMRNDADASSDLLLESSQKIVSIKGQDGKDKEIKDKDMSIYLTGIDTELKFFDLVDNKDKSLVSKLSERNSAIINHNVMEILGINIGDTVYFDYNGVKLEFKVVGVSEQFFTSNIYVNRKYLSDTLGIDLSYNKKYTNDDKYNSNSKIDEKEMSEISSIMDFVDMKRNIGDRMQVFNSAIYIVIGFASLMSLIIIAVIANIVVEENKKTISLMKVMGYKNKEISKVVLNIYTPFVIIFYLLSIPIMINILKSIVKAITKDIEMAIPIEISPFMAGIGLIGLVLAYYIAVLISRRVLNKVPLAVALKRE